MKINNILKLSKKTFVTSIIILMILIVIAITLTYLVPKGIYQDDVYVALDTAYGIPIWRGLLAPFLVLGTDEGINLITLSVFLMVVMGAIQVLSYTDSLQNIIQKTAKRFEKCKFLLLSIIILLFMCCGAFFGLFEETLVLLPFIIALTLSMGYDSYTGFLICTVATGLGFSTAISNPFTILVACRLINVDFLDGIWFRMLTFIIIYSYILFIVFIHIKRIKKNPHKSPTYKTDCHKVEIYSNESLPNSELKVQINWINYLFFGIIIIITVIFTMVSSLKDYTILVLTIIIGIGSIIVGIITEKKELKKIFIEFIKGIITIIPAVALILMAAGIKYIFEEGQIIATITNYLQLKMSNNNPSLNVMIIFMIVVTLEFFISASAAKAVIVMAVLGGAITSLNISKELLILIYAYGDGFTNIIFPSSPALLIALGITGISYFEWLKRGKWIFLSIVLLIIIFLSSAYLLGY